MSGFVLLDAYPEIEFKYQGTQPEPSTWTVDQFRNQSARTSSTHLAQLDTAFAICIPRKEALTIPELLTFTSIKKFLTTVDSWCLDYLKKHSNFNLLDNWFFSHSLILFKRVPFINSLEMNLAVLRQIDEMERAVLTDSDTLNKTKGNNSFYFNGRGLSPRVLSALHGAYLERYDLKVFNQSKSIQDS